MIMGFLSHILKHFVGIFFFLRILEETVILWKAFCGKFNGNAASFRNTSFE